MLDFWRPQPLFSGERVFVVGGGPSLRSQPLERLRGRPTIVVNQMGHELPWASILFFGDESWMLRRGPENLALVAGWEGLVLTASHTAQMTLPEKVRRVHFHHRVGAPPILHRWPAVSAGWGRSSGHKAVSVAVLLCAAEVVMLGYDCRFVDGRSHAHDGYSHSTDSAFQNWLPAWQGWRREAERLGVRIVNATPNSALDEFERANLEDLL